MSVLTPSTQPRPTLCDQDFKRSLIDAIHEASPDGILVVDDKDVIVSHNQRFFDVFSILPEEIPGARDGVLNGLPDRLLLSLAIDRVKDKEGFLQRVQKLYADPLLEDKCEVELKDDRTLERHSRALWGAGHQYLGRVWFFRDITEHKQLEAALREMSRQDPLTGVANRRHFFEVAAEEFSRARRFGRDLSFIMLDIDWFKRINDKWGHAAGDKVLKALCESAQSALRQVDLFARIGGEEFAVLVPDTNLDSAFLLAERLRLKAAALGVAEGPDSISFTLSAGVSSLMPEDASAEDALKRADSALYRAKQAGRNRTEQTLPPGAHA